MRTVFVLAVCAILTLSFFIACDRSPTKFDDPPDPYPDTWFPPGTVLTPADTIALVTVLNWLKTHGGDHGIIAPESQLTLLSVDSDAEGNATVSLGQAYRSIPVFHKRAGFLVVASYEVEVAWISFDREVSLDVSVTPSLGEAEAIEKFLESHPDEMGYTEVQHSRLMIYPNRIGYQLVWRLWSNSTNGETAAEYLYDAHTGAVVLRKYYSVP